MLVQTSRAVRGAALLAATVFCIDAQNTNNSEITIYEAGRGWTLAGKPVVKGQRLSPTAELSGNEAESSDLVINCGKDGLIGYACDHRPCRVPVCSTKVSGVIIAGLNTRNAMAASGSTKDSYLTRAPKPLAILGVRAGGSLSDAVVLRSDTDIHWGPAFKRVLEGSYCIRATTLPAEGSASSIIAVNWDKTVDPEGIVPSPKLQAGLYSVEKGTPAADGHCVMDPDLPAVWVLVVPAANYEQIDRSWKDSTGQLSPLQEAGATPFMLATFRHALLSYLADWPTAKPRS